MKPVLLKLGGKSPFIVLDDADLDQAVAAGAFGTFMHQGQICMSSDRFVVDEAVADEFAAKLATKAASLPAGNPRGQAILVGLYPQPPPTAASVATAANAAAIPISIGSPLVTNGRPDRAKTNGRTGRMHGLMIVSTPPR